MIYITKEASKNKPKSCLIREKIANGKNNIIRLMKLILFIFIFKLKSENFLEDNLILAFILYIFKE